jgi:hypothetical protein
VRREYFEFAADASDRRDPDLRAHPWIAAWELGSATVVWEPGRSQGIYPWVLTAVTEGGIEAFSVDTANEKSVSFLYVVDGVILAQFAKVAGRPDLLGVRGEDAQRVLQVVDRLKMDVAKLRKVDAVILQREVMNTVVVPPIDLDIVIAARIRPRPFPDAMLPVSPKDMTMNRKNIN